MLTGIFAKIAWGVLWGRVKANATHDWQSLPPKAKLALLAVAAAAALFFVHQHHAHKALKAADRAGYERARGEDEKVLADLRRKLAIASANMAKVSQDQRSRNDAANRDIVRAADALSVQGPGAAGCSRRPVAAVPAAAGRPQPPAQPVGAAAAAMPAENGADQLAGVPWRWLVGTGKQCDLERAENVAWRGAYQGWVAEWAKLRASTDARR